MTIRKWVLFVKLNQSNHRRFQKNVCYLVFFLFVSLSLLILSSKYIFLERKEIKESPIFAYYVDGEKTLEMPSKDLGYTLSSESKCNNGVIISWDDESYSAFINYSNFQLEDHKRTFCELHFEKNIFIH